MRVIDAVGVIVVDDLQLVIHPKIPLQHFLYLLELGGYIPRLANRVGIADVDVSLWHLVARWYVTATEHALRHDLIRDYQPAQGPLAAARGHIVAMDTARAYYTGRLEFHCRYEEFGFDTPLNRVLNTAALAVAASVTLDTELRRRARAVAARIEPVSSMRQQDLRVTTERRTRHFDQALGWARHVLLARGRTLHIAEAAVWTFLIRTPEPIEAGIRTLLQRRFPQARITKYGKRLDGTSLTMNPDLVVQTGAAVADVKYKLYRGAWDRSDLYQLVTFAAAFGSKASAVLSFVPPEAAELPRLRVGEISVDHVGWPADPAVSPDEAAQVCVSSADRWLGRSHCLKLLPTSPTQK